jgi:hypothetical protein
MSSPSYEQRRLSLLQTIQKKHLIWTEEQTTHNLFDYIHIEKKSSASQELVIYIEGDGLAWETKDKLSINPTPLSLDFLEIFFHDSRSHLLYLGRPGQFLHPTWYDSSYPHPSRNRLIISKSDYWSLKRFAPEIIHSFYQTILKKKSSHQKLHFIGLSGGAHIAIVLASLFPQETKSIITIGGNLHHQLLHQYHRVSNFPHTPVAFDYISKIAHIPQQHFIGEFDSVIPITIIKLFVSSLKKENPHACAEWKILPEAMHDRHFEYFWKNNFYQLLDC